VVDLRVDDNPQPLAELRRLYERHLAYEAMNAGDEALAAGDTKAALGHYTRAAGLAPDVVELPFWQAVTLFTEGHESEALPIFRRVFTAEPRWARLVPRLPAAGLLPDDPAALARILGEAWQGPEGGDGGAAAGAPGGGGDAGGAAAGGAASDGAAEHGAVEVTGRLTGEGVECPALRAEDGTLYTLTGDLAGFGPGDRVRLTGRVAETSICMQGTTLAVDSIEAAG
jgi:tetratricopeptide (TPR) repeat protein